MKEIDNKLTQKFDEYPSFGVLKGVKVFVCLLYTSDAADD